VTPQSAAKILDSAYAMRATGVCVDMVGIFGEGFPEPLLRAAGLQPVCMHLTPETDDACAGQGVSECIEPFVDHTVRRFLHRFATGWYQGLHAIIFCRDDTAALVAYQYALEFRRLGLAPTGPRLILWNLVHAPHAHDFNMRQLAKLWQSLNTSAPTESALASTWQDECTRADALAALDADIGQNGAGISASTALIWRIAGRGGMDGRQHAELIFAARPSAPRPARAALRFGLIGSGVTEIALYRTIEAHGAIVCDMQPMTAAWPVPLPQQPTADAFLRAAASDPACARVVPPDIHTDTVLRRLTDAQCDAVICQLHPDDDVFGWDVPQISAHLHKRAIPFINLGFIHPVLDTAALNTISAALSHELQQRGLT